MKKAQVLLVFAAFLVIVFGFQNCSAPLPEEEGTETGSSTSARVAFNTEVDQLAYMSCHQLGSNFDRSSFFTFRVGAYGPSSGVGLTLSSLQEMASLPKGQWKSKLASEQVGAQPLLSIRDVNNPQSLKVNQGSTTPVAGFDHSILMGVLTDDYILDEILKDTSKLVRYKRNGTPEGARFEGDLNMNLFVGGLNDTQFRLAQDSVIGLNYPSRSNSVISLRANPAGKVYGKGLKPTFKNLHPASTTSIRWALDTVSEQNMENGAVQSNKLTCDSKLVFKIADPVDVRAAATTDSTKIHCERKPDDPNSLTAVDRELLRRARLSLRVEDWYIDWTRKCIVPKKFGDGRNLCYGSVNRTVPIEYDLTKTCVDSPTVNSVRACVALASICTR